jgi:tetratricopeptide (TPR) repeat protein
LARALDDAFTIRSLAASVSLSTDARDLLRLRSQALSTRAPSAEQQLGLGALEHELAKVTGDPAYLVSAFEHTEEGLEADPSSLTGLFNRGLIAADLGLCRVAAHTWRQYRERDPASGWADEAKARLALLPCIAPEGEPPRVSPDSLFKNAIEELLPRWVEARREGSSEASTILLEILRIGDELQARAGEPMIRELARELATAGDPKSLAGIAAHVTGRALFEAETYGEARDKLQAAEQSLRGRRRWLARWNDVWLAGVDLNEGHFQEAESRLGRLARSPELARSPHLAGRVFWAWGLAALRSGRLETAHDRIVRADEEFRRGGYSTSTAAMRILRADSLSRLGFEREAWEPRVYALRALQDARGPFSFFHNGLVDGATSAQQSGAPHVADAFLEEAAEVAHAQGNAMSEAEALLTKVDALRRRGAQAEASDAVRRALVAIRFLPPGIVRERFEKTAVIWGDPAPAGSTGEAELRAATLFFAEKGPPVLQLQALRLQAEHERRSGSLAAARSTMDTAVQVLRRLQSHIGTDEAGIRQLDSMQDFFDEAIDTAVAENQPLRALELLEGARRDGDPTTVSGEIAKLHLEKRQDSLQNDGEPVLVVLGLTSRTFVWWRLEGDTVRWGWRKAAPVAAAVRKVVDAAPSGRVKAVDLEHLYDLLLGDSLHGVAPGRPLVLVPDGLLQRVPFSALWNPATKVRLIEQRAVSLRTSFRAARERSRTASPTRGRVDWRVVAVGDPAFDTQRIPLPRLPGAAHEAGEVARLYGKRGTLLTGQAAGAEAVSRAMASSEVLHLAAHTRVSSDAFRQTFVLAESPDGASSGLVTAADLLPAKTPLQLAVLSGCSTLGLQPSRSGGLLGLARAFVARGIPAIVGTLWPVEDRQVSGLMTDFHRFLLRGDSAAEALRQSQLAYLKQRPDACCDWAALQLVGDIPAESVRNP